MKNLLKIIFLIIAGLMFFWVLPLAAGEIEDLKSQVQALRQENQDLKGKVSGLQESLKSQDDLIGQLSSRLEKLELKESPELVVKREQASLIPQVPKMEFKGYNDISFKLQKADNRADASPSAFSHGQLDFLVSSVLSEKISFFSEVVLTYATDNMNINAERLYLKYSLSDLFKIILGRVHTPFGYWNATYHHGGWFQTAASRPSVLTIMPTHSTGLTFEGRKEFSRFKLDYNFGLYNGRSNLRTRYQNTQDANDHKAFFGVFTLRPRFLPGLGVGFDAYVDKIPAATTPAARIGEIGELILGGHLTYIKNKIEFLSEGYLIRHNDEVSARVFDTTGFYLQAGYKIKDKWTPYYRFDLLDFGQDAPYFSSNSGTTAVDIDSEKHTLGARWDISAWNALKLEYSYTDRRGASDQHAVTLNDCFTF